MFPYNLIFFFFRFKFSQEPDDDDGLFDLKRNQKRFTEFNTRFGRNYLYQMERTVSE